MKKDILKSAAVLALAIAGVALVLSGVGRGSDVTVALGAASFTTAFYLCAKWLEEESCMRDTCGQTIEETNNPQV